MKEGWVNSLLSLGLLGILLKEEGVGRRSKEERTPIK